MHPSEDAIDANVSPARMVLGTTAADFRAFADVLDAVRREGRVVVLGAGEALAEANAERGDFLKIQRVL